jgi:hypothetical protein
MPHRFAKAHLVRGPEPLGFFSGKEIRHLKPFFPDLLVDAQEHISCTAYTIWITLPNTTLLIARRALSSGVGRERDHQAVSCGKKEFRGIDIRRPLRRAVSLSRVQYGPCELVDRVRICDWQLRGITTDKRAVGLSEAIASDFYRIKGKLGTRIRMENEPT